MKFVHITDTHLVPPGESLCGLEPSARLAKAIETVNRSDGDAAFAVITGDLSYHGMEPAYRTLRHILGDLAMPHHLLIGNHDDRESFKRIFPETPVWCIGWKPKIDATPWVITEVTHNLTETSYNTALQLECNSKVFTLPYTGYNR